MEKVTIRRTEPSDADALKQIFESEEVYTQTMQLPYPSQQLWSGRLAEVPDHIHSLVALCGDEVVGNVSVSMETRARRRHVAHLGIVVKAGFSGKGVGSLMLNRIVDLCDNWLGIRRIELTVFSDNDRAIALYRRFNFEVEGEARGYAMRDGQYTNVLYMARVNEGVFSDREATATVE